MKSRPANERFDDLTIPEPTSGCWLWIGAAGTQPRDQYGRFRLSGAPNDIIRAHVFAYERAHGPVPDGLQIDHLCRTTLCVNPDHLEAVTPTENMRRGNSPHAINARKTHCKRGHELTEANCYTGPRRACRHCAREAARARSHALAAKGDRRAADTVEIEIPPGVPRAKSNR